MTWGTNENHIGSRPKVRDGILGNVYSEIRNLNGDFNSILPINRWTNRMVELDIGTVPTPLC